MWNIGDRGWTALITEDAQVEVLKVEITGKRRHGMVYINILSKEETTLCWEHAIFRTREQSELDAWTQWTQWTQDLLIRTGEASPSSNWVKEGF